MSMTRDEAIAELDEAITNSQILLISMGYDSDGVTKKIAHERLALSILAPEPRKEPPTVEEVGDEELCWAMDDDSDQWSLMKGSFVRAWFGTNGMIPLRQWLPTSALPKGDV